MGNWNRRWQPRRKYYQEPPLSTPRPHTNESRNPPGVWQNSVPSWERKFCTLVGSIPWQKVVVAKKYMHCHSDVINWNDSAGEEAFHNAKKRFWAEINSLPCDITLPDPNIYIDEIDWNSKIDPELMLDVDREYFNPDEGKNNDKVEITIQKAHNSVSGPSLGLDVKNLGNCGNPWECGYVQGTAQGWDNWDNSRNLDNVDNPWERGSSQGNGASKDNAWGGCADTSREFQPGLNCINQANNLDNNYDNPWERGFQTVGSVKLNGSVNVGNNSWGNRWKVGVHESRNMTKVDNPWQNNFLQDSGAPNDRGWRDCRDNSWHWKQLENGKNEQKYIDSRKTNGGWQANNGGCRKREGSNQYPLRYKSSRFQGDDYGTCHHWRKGGTQKRSSYVFE
ncbi:uncharacterized protein LOC132295099 [Cornus florida]|uniref:uncharacterized protein LOC132295099 n=1 Tax=Cornus florida TaxID=4283 RepID=UPI00289C6A60|nr:uncharacterized protein LOC132295099 [Cornus florida]